MAAMKSYAHQTMSVKRVKKLAARYTDQEIRATLQDDKNNRAYIGNRTAGRKREQAVRDK